MISIVPVRGRRMVDRFAAFPLELYRGDPQWIPPLTSEARRFMDPARNPYFREADIDHFLAIDGRGRALGRISTTIDPAYVARFGRTGFFGWFETVRDPEVASLLLSRAEAWATERGMDRLAGPYSYCATQEFGLLVGGYDNRPAFFQPHNPPYYTNLLTELGYRQDFRTDTFSWDADHHAAELTRLVDRGEAVRKRLGLKVRSLDPGKWEREVDLIYELLASSFAENHDMVPMSPPVMRYQADALKAFLDPRLTRFVEADGQTIGFSVLSADANEVLAVAHGRLTPGFLLRYPMLKRRIRGTVVLMIGARPDAPGPGIGRVLAGEIARVGLGLVPPYRAVHTTWVHEHNWQSRALIAQTGARPARTYAVFGKDLTK